MIQQKVLMAGHPTFFITPSSFKTKKNLLLKLPFFLKEKKIIIYLSIFSLLFVFLKPWLSCMLHINWRLSTIQSLWLLSVLSVQDGAHRVPAGPRFLLHVYLLFSHVSFMTFKHVKDALDVILWFLYCLGFLSIEQILFVIYPGGLVGHVDALPLQAAEQEHPPRDAEAAQLQLRESLPCVEQWNQVTRVLKN